jgi:hypothetical protein
MEGYAYQVPTRSAYKSVDGNNPIEAGYSQNWASVSQKTGRMQGYNSLGPAYPISPSN